MVKSDGVRGGFLGCEGGDITMECGCGLLNVVISVSGAVYGLEKKW